MYCSSSGLRYLMKNMLLGLLIGMVSSRPCLGRPAAIAAARRSWVFLPPLRPRRVFLNVPQLLLVVRGVEVLEEFVTDAEKVLQLLVCVDNKGVELV